MVSFASPLLGSLSSMQLYTSPQHTASFTSHLSSGIFSTHAAEFVQSFPRGEKNPKEGFFLFSHHIFVPFLVVFFFLQTIQSFYVCMLTFCGRMIQHAAIRVKFNTYIVWIHLVPPVMVLLLY